MALTSALLFAVPKKPAHLRLPIGDSNDECPRRSALRH